MGFQVFYWLSAGAFHARARSLGDLGRGLKAAAASLSDP